MGNTITLKDLLGVDVTEVKSGSEIMFIYELSKYTKQLLNKTLDLTGVSLLEVLKKSNYYAYVYLKGLTIGYSPSNSELVDITDISRSFFEADLGGIVFEKRTKEEWVYDYNTNRDANLVLNKYNRSAGYVSLYAYMIVLSYKEKTKVPLLVLKNTSTRQEEFEYVDVLILSFYGNAFLKDKVKIKYSREVVNQPEWEAYLIYHRQLNMMNKEISTSEKFNYIRRHFTVGDVVLYYRTEKAVKSKTIRRLISCYPAVIDDIKDGYITITYYPDISTKLTRMRELQEAEEVFDGEYSFSYEDYKRFSHCTIKMDYYNLGVDKLFYTEEEYIITPQNGVDTTRQYLVNAKGIESSYEMDTLNTIYAVFEDRGVSYDKERFLQKYFATDMPLYDKIMKTTDKKKK